MSTHRDEYIDLCAGYAIGSLGADDVERLERHLASGCRECGAALADFSEATVLLAASAGPARPSAALRDRVMIAAGSIHAGTPSAEATASNGRGRIFDLPLRQPTPFWTGFAWAAAAASLVIASLLTVEAKKLREDVDQREAQVSQLGQQLADQKRLTEVLSAPGARVANLDLTPAGQHELRARATFDPRTRGAVVVFDHFIAPSGHDYELWAIRGASPVSLGVIHTDATGHAVIRLDNVGDASTLNAFAVSLEKAGGSPDPGKPNGPVVMLGKLSS